MLHRAALVALLLAGFGLAGCSLFEPREPEPPVVAGGTYVQPDTPDRVVDNLASAVREANVGNYRRSLGDDFVFRPTAAVQAGDLAYWAAWGRSDEDAYFGAVAAALQPGALPTLVLRDEALVFLSDGRYTFEAAYRLTVPHRRTDVPAVFEGRLVWELVQGADGLWALQAWTDEAVPDAASWSELKASFGR